MNTEHFNEHWSFYWTLGTLMNTEHFNEHFNEHWTL